MIDIDEVTNTQTPIISTSLTTFSLLLFIITIAIYTDMTFIALIAYILLSILITTLLCAIIGSFNIITDEKDQKMWSYIIFIVVFVLLIIGESNDSAIAHMFKA